MKIYFKRRDVHNNLQEKKSFWRLLHPNHSSLFHEIYIRENRHCKENKNKMYIGNNYIQMKVCVVLEQHDPFNMGNMFYNQYCTFWQEENIFVGDFMK